MGDGCWTGEWIWAVDGEAGFGRVGCRSKVSSKKVKAMIPFMRRGKSQKNGRCCTWFKFVRWIKGMSLAIAVEGKIFSNCMAILRASTQKVGGRFIPTKTIKKLKEKGNELRAIIKGIINKRKTLAIHVGDGSHDDLLGCLLKSNLKEIEEAGVGMSMEDVIDECKLIYLAATETISTLILWTMVCLSLHQEWQTIAREEIMQAFGTGELNLEGLKHLKNVTMILNEVLRLYPPATMVVRATHKHTKLRNMTIPSGMNIIIPILHVHHDPDIWGDDAREFKPERFSDGVANATKGRGSASYLPFGAAIAKILQRFSFELSPSYKHSPAPMFALTPVFGAPLILRKI
ncbi:cytochrome P450 CYP72A219-like protein [Tanacetum coccineum]